MATRRLLPVQLNPLQCFALDEPWASLPNRPPVSLDGILESLCAKGLPRDIESLAARWRELSTETVRLFAPPAEPKVLAKLVWPLREAKANYVLGNYVATIAVSGMVGEMVAILIWEMAEEDSKVRQKRHRKGKAFERLGQEERVNDLVRCKLVDALAQREFTLLRTTRRKYLHIWSESDNEARTDAAAMYRAALARVTGAIGPVSIRDGVAEYDPRLFAYLEKKGFLASPVEGGS